MGRECASRCCFLALRRRLCGRAAAAGRRRSFASDVQLVRILATVKDPSGALVGSLEKDDFEVRDNGVPQQISVFERQTDQPLSVAVLIDNSGSTAKDLKYETDSVTRFLRALLREGNPEDAVALYSFNWEIVKQNGFTRNVAAVERSLRALRGEAGTSLYDAILLASRDIEDRRGPQGPGDRHGWRRYHQPHRFSARRRSRATGRRGDLSRAGGADHQRGGPQRRRRECADHACRSAPAAGCSRHRSGAALDQTFDQIIRDLRTQYLLGFYPKDVPLTKERFHTLEISLAAIRDCR